MSDPAPGVAIDEAWRAHSRRVLATLIRLLGDFDLAEEALHEAFVAAAHQWPNQGLPKNPAAWLVSAGRFKAIDMLRRRARFDAARPELTRQLSQEPEETEAVAIIDDRLRLIFVCCHPVLSPEAQVALTLREVCGLTTEEIARAFLMRAPALGQRIVRAKSRIREEGVAYVVPDRAELPARLDAVLRVIYLVFNEGYSAHSGTALLRTELSNEAIRLGRLMVELLPDAETLGLLGLMLIHESRRIARVRPNGDIVLLADQDRANWDNRLIAEGVALVKQAFSGKQIGPYTLQAAIASVHAKAATAEATDWKQIVTLYDVLRRAAPSPIVDLNRAVAIGMDRGPKAGLELVNALLASGSLTDYHLAYSALADFHRRLGETAPAAHAYAKALELCRQEPERRFLQSRLVELGPPPPAV